MESISALISEEFKYVDIEDLYMQYFYIARYLNWSRHEIKWIPSKERIKWVKMVIDHENERWGGGDNS